MIRVLHLLLAFNLLVSTVGVGVFEHLCQMRGYSASLVAPVKSCCAKQAEKKGCCKGQAFAKTAFAKTAFAKTSDAPSMSKAPCCQDHASWLQADLDGTHVSPQAVASSTMIAWPVLAKAELPASPQIASISLKVVQAMRYKPPCPERDVRVRVQSFQI